MQVNKALNNVVRFYENTPATKLNEIFEKNMKLAEGLEHKKLKEDTYEKQIIENIESKQPFAVKKLMVKIDKLFDNLEKEDSLEKVSNKFMSNESPSNFAKQSFKILTEQKANLRRLARKNPEINEGLKDISKDLKNPTVINHIKKFTDIFTQQPFVAQTEKLSKAFPENIQKSMKEMSEQMMPKVKENPAELLKNWIDGITKK